MTQHPAHPHMHGERWGACPEWAALYSTSWARDLKPLTPEQKAAMLAAMDAVVRRAAEQSDQA